MPASNSLGTTQGLTSIQSSFGPKETMERGEARIQARGLNVFARIDHAAGSAEVGLPLKPTELIIFGNARGGTPLMQSVQTVGIDLPLKFWFGRTQQTTHGFRITSQVGSRSGTALPPQSQRSIKWLICSGR